MCSGIAHLYIHYTVTFRELHSNQEIYGKLLRQLKSVLGVITVESLIGVELN